jgi:transposase
LPGDRDAAAIAKELVLPRSVRIVLATEPVDMRRGHDGLCAIVRHQWRLDPFAGHLLVFLGKRADRLKCLFWDRGGFVLYYKIASSYQRSSKEPRESELDAVQLSMLLDGIDFGRVRRPELWEPGPASQYDASVVAHLVTGKCSDSLLSHGGQSSCAVEMSRQAEPRSTACSCKLDGYWLP